MKIALVGYGQMGREVEKVAVARNHSILIRVDPVDEEADTRELSEASLADADAAIEFALSDGVVANARCYSRSATPAVVGTTGWEGKRDDVLSLFSESGSLVYGGNFSIGANVFGTIVEQAARLISELEGFDILMYEIHHNKKRDSPSGTALHLANRIVSAGSKRSIVTERLDRPPKADELHVASVRGGSTPGVHSVIVDSASDSIELIHRARNRSGFATGAVLAAEWLVGKRGVYTVEEFIDDLIGQEGVR